tara:strand:+ start:2906 stop:6097 length:3192 start_codon:yes stop_codon:yes gene_type:complete
MIDYTMQKCKIELKKGYFLDDYHHSFDANWINGLDQQFLLFLKDTDQECYDGLVSLREHKIELSSQRLIDISLYLERFLIHIFDLESDYAHLRQKTEEYQHLSLIYEWVQKKLRHRIRKMGDQPSIQKPSQDYLQPFLKDNLSAELEFAQYIYDHPDEEEHILAVLLYAHYHQYSWQSLNQPKRRVDSELVAFERDEQHYLHGKSKVGRDGFSHTLSQINDRQIFHETNYCIYCHSSETDFCRKGFPVKKGEPAIKLDAHDVYLTGCPLDEKISEMNWLQHIGHPLAAFAVIMCDNPMVPATGHRICNECLKACIYQKQTPVDVPQIETHILNQTLSLPWGVEIYDLLARWNPLRPTQWAIKPASKESVLVMGLGPAGFSLLHHLSMEGLQVVGMDGMTLKPLPSDWVNQPIKHYSDIYEDGEERPFRGFGGVSEYGITARWDKNYLKLIQLMLMRRQIPMFGGARFGGNIDFDQAWQWGFSHFTIAVGAGLPNAIDIPNSMSPGMRQANDFLMTLHQGAISHMSELEVRLPIYVIGSGLTAIDTATEVQAYYVRQVARCQKIYETLEEKGLIEVLKSSLSHRQWAQLMTFLEHARIISKRREDAMKHQQVPDFSDLFHQWGGVHVLYRRSLQNSPAYRLNPEEIDEAFKQGIIYHENTTPLDVVLDEDEHVQSLKVRDGADHEHIFEAGAILVATGASPNVAFSFEHRGLIEKEGRYYKGFRWNNQQLEDIEVGVHCKDQPIAPITSYQYENKRVSFIGDGQPAYHGSVVRAIASAGHAYPQIVQLLKETHSDSKMNPHVLFDDFEHTLISKDERHGWNHLIIQSPLIARKWQAGQFIRIECKNQDPIALYPYHTDNEKIYIYTLQHLDLDDFGCMGPTGVRLGVPRSSAIILLDIDEEGMNAGLSFALKLSQDAHLKPQIHIQTNDRCMAILKAHLPDISMSQNDESIPNWAYTHVWVLGEPKRVQFVQRLRKEGYFNSQTQFVAATYGPMQCMLKGVCAQCLQWQIDPETQLRTKAVYACSWQHQPMDIVAWDHAQRRRKSNPIMKQIVKMWQNINQGEQ